MTGSERLAEIGEELGRLVRDKNIAYGSSFETCVEHMKILYPDGISPDQYTDALLVVRVLDKLNRISNKKGAFGESPWADVAGYGICGAKKDGWTSG